jgi:hypothetical protein
MMAVFYLQGGVLLLLHNFMKEIPLTQGKVALVDDDMLKELAKYKWHFACGYARRTVKGNHIKIHMHRVIMNTPQGFDTDHINGNKLDNRKINLRICSRSENNKNVGKRKNNTSGYKGVYWDKNRNQWSSCIKVFSKTVQLGCFKEKEEAYKAYCEAAKKYHGEFSNVA